MEGQIPSKNFIQDDVAHMGGFMDSNRRDWKVTADRFRAMFTARYMVIKYLKGLEDSKGQKSGIQSRCC